MDRWKRWSWARLQNKLQNLKNSLIWFPRNIRTKGDPIKSKYEIYNHKRRQRQNNNVLNCLQHSVKTDQLAFFTSCDQTLVLCQEKNWIERLSTVHLPHITCTTRALVNVTSRWISSSSFSKISGICVVGVRSSN